MELNHAYALTWGINLLQGSMLELGVNKKLVEYQAELKQLVVRVGAGRRVHVCAPITQEKKGGKKGSFPFTKAFTLGSEWDRFPQEAFAGSRNANQANSTHQDRCTVHSEAHNGKAKGR